MFTEFPDDLLQQIRSVSKLVNYEANDKIMVQGEFNQMLYFLAKGSVAIYVDGGLVAELGRRGDLLGEMSLITKKPCSATILAKTPVELIKVDTEAFKELTTENKDQFDHALYRIYSKILTDKLHITNQKAKMLEDTMSALKQAKVELQELNKNLENKVLEKTAALQGRLEDLLKNNLSPLKSSLSHIANQVPDSAKEAFGKSLNSVDGVIAMLEPITSGFKTEASIKNKKVFFADDDKKQLLLAKMALGGTGVKLTTSFDKEEAKSSLQTEPYDLLLCSSEMLPLMKMAKQTNPNTQLVFVSSESIQSYLPKLNELDLFPSIVTRDLEDRAATIKCIMTTVTKLAGANIFGLEKYFNWGAEIHELEVKRSDERVLLREKMATHFSALGIRRSLIDTVGIVLEEMLMNAIYDAPVDPMGKSLYNHLPRTEVIELPPEQRSRLRFGFDGTHIGISVEDPFGGLGPQTVLKYLESCYGGRAGEINKKEGKGGAGRGLHQIIENSQLVIFNVTPRSRTEVIALFNMIPGERTEKEPQFHYFS